MPIGIVTFFSDIKGFGFIRPIEGGQPVFVHTSAVKAAGLDDLKADQYVTFHVRSNSVRPFAEGIRLETETHPTFLPNIASVASAHMF